MKKLLAIFCTVAVLLSLCAIPAAAAGSGSLYLSSASGKPGDTVTLSVNLSNNPGLVSMRFSVEYGSDLELVSVSNAGLLGGWTKPSSTIASPYTIRWADSLAEENNFANGKILTLTFKIKDTAAPGKATVQVNFLESRDYDLAKNSFNSPSATITIGCKTHTYGGWSMADNQNHVRACSACGAQEKAAHSWDGGKVTTPASCTAKGEKTYTCSVCKAAKTEEIPMTDHTYTTIVKLDGNNHKKTCSCGAFVTEKHTWDAGKVTTPASCTAKGVKTFTCSACKDTKTEEIPMTEHNYGGFGKVNDEVHRKVCSCGDAVTEKHTWDAGKVTTPASCTAEGVKTFTCSACKATKTEAVPMTAHKYGGAVEVDANSHSKKCSGCGDTVTENHTFSTRWSSNNSRHWHACSACGAWRDDAAHTESGWITDKEAQPMEAGSRHTSCTVCGRTLRTETIPATGCQHEGDQATTGTKEPNCLEEGYTGDTACAVCGTVLEQGSVIPATGHTLQTRNAKEATCDEAGYTGDQVCSECGVTAAAGEVVEAKGHQYQNGLCANCGVEDPAAQEPAPEPVDHNGDKSGMSCWLWILLGLLAVLLLLILILLLKKKKKK